MGAKSCNRSSNRSKNFRHLCILSQPSNRHNPCVESTNNLLCLHRHENYQWCRGWDLNPYSCGDFTDISPFFLISIKHVNTKAMETKYPRLQQDKQGILRTSAYSLLLRFCVYKLRTQLALLRMLQLRLTEKD